jgi:hypothetical protein
MREYGRIKTQFWTDVKILRLTDRGKLLMNYLLTGPHTNSIGCFRLPSGYIEADLGWVPDTVAETLGELLREGLIERCDKSGWTLIVNFLKHNPIENPNVGRAAMPFIEAVPSTMGFFGRYADTLKPYAERFPKGYLDGLANGTPNGMGNREPDPEPNPKPDSESAIEAKDGDGSANSSDNGFSLADMDIEGALRVWNDLASELGLPQVQKLTDARKAKLRARLKDTGGVGEWAKVLVKIRESRFLRGEVKNDWRANFDFVLQESSFNKLREGAYSDKRQPEAASVPITFQLSPDIVATLKAADFTDEEIKRWFDEAKFFDGGKRITVKTAFMKDWIGNHYEAKLCRAFGGAPALEVMHG